MMISSQQYHCVDSHSYYKLTQYEEGAPHLPPHTSILILRIRVHPFCPNRGSFAPNIHIIK